MSSDDINQGGTPLKLTPDLQARLCDAVRAGVRPETAATYCGIGGRTYYRWMQLGRAADAKPVYVEFVEAVELASLPNGKPAMCS